MKRRKGFTLVELVIVIAVIVILAAVLIPTFSGVIEKANNAKDFSLVSEMNKVLALEEATDGKNETMYDATLVLEEYGMNIEKLPSSKGYIYVWNSKENRVAVLDKDYKLVFPQGEEIKDSNKENYFAVAKTEEEINNLYSLGYSVYLKESVDIATIDATQGFDAGKNTKVVTVNYSNTETTKAQTIVIRTNSGELNVNAPTNTVHHFGYTKALSVEAVSTEDCYHEHGYVNELKEFKQGKLVVAKTAEFHQTKEELEAVVSSSSATFEDSGASYGKHNFNADEVCTECNEISDKHVHKLNDGKVEKSCTYTQTGEYSFTCKTCGRSVKETVDATSSKNVVSVKYFLVLKDIIENMSKTDGEITLKLEADLATSSLLAIEQKSGTNIILDLNGHSLALYNSVYSNGKYESGLVVQGTFRVTDSSVAKSGKIIASTNSDNVGKGGLITVQTADFVLDSGKIDATNCSKGCAIMMWHSGCVTIEKNGEVIANGYAISGSKNDDHTFASSQLLITGGTITSLDSSAIYHPQYASEDKGKFEITGGTITGKEHAIYLGGNTSSTSGKHSGTTVTISGGTLEAEEGSVIYVDSTYLNSTAKNYAKVRIMINDGTFSTTKSNLFAEVEMNDSCYFNGSYRKGSSGFVLYLKGGTYKNISQSKFVETIDIINAKKEKKSEPIAATKKLSNGFVINPENNNTKWNVVSSTAE